MTNCYETTVENSIFFKSTGCILIDSQTTNTTIRGCTLSAGKNPLTDVPIVDYGTGTRVFANTNHLPKIESANITVQDTVTASRFVGKLGDTNITGTITITNGNVGIGTVSPANNLSIYTTAAGNIGGLGLQYSGSGGGNWLFTPYINGINNGGLAFYDKGSNVTPFAISAGGNVGIGTTAPQTKLDVNGIISSGYSGGNGEIRSYQSAGVGDYVSLKTDAVTAHRSGIDRFNAGVFNFYDTSTGDVGLDAQYSGANLVFQIGSAEKMRVANNGNVGIGTKNPVYMLDVTNQIHAGGGFVSSNGVGATQNVMIQTNASGPHGYTLEFTNGLFINAVQY